MTELFGDASRNGDWAAVRLRVREDRIVDADADGLSEDLAGLTMLEAAAVDGEELVVEALAAALGPVFRAAPSSSRVAVAMSGGVDSAVALLRCGRDAVGVTLRLWVDPEAPHTERACCSPDAVRGVGCETAEGDIAGTAAGGGATTAAATAPADGGGGGIERAAGPASARSSFFVASFCTSRRGGTSSRSMPPIARPAMTSSKLPARSMSAISMCWPFIRARTYMATSSRFTSFM